MPFPKAIITMPLREYEPAFTGQPQTHSFAGVLFDMDGTIVDSTDAIVKHWTKLDSHQLQSFLVF